MKYLKRRHKTMWAETETSNQLCLALLRITNLAVIVVAVVVIKFTSVQSMKHQLVCTHVYTYVRD